jgi:hypothetical protein
VANLHISGRQVSPKPADFLGWRGGREAEGGGLLNRYTVISRIVGSNPIPSANTAEFLAFCLLRSLFNRRKTVATVPGYDPACSR